MTDSSEEELSPEDLDDSEGERFVRRFLIAMGIMFMVGVVMLIFMLTHRAG